MYYGSILDWYLGDIVLEPLLSTDYPGTHIFSWFTQFPLGNSGIFIYELFTEAGLEIRKYGRGDPSRWPRDTLYP
jgi:hypothetical protein